MGYHYFMIYSQNFLFFSHILDSGISYQKWLKIISAYKFRWIFVSTTNFLLVQWDVVCVLRENSAFEDSIVPSGGSR